MTSIALIAAVSENGVIGRDSRLPWKIPSYWRLFLRYTSGNPVIMGRVTFRARPKVLSSFSPIVLTRGGGLGGHKPPLVAPDWPWALALAEARALERGAAEIIVAGGASVYAEAMPHASRIYLMRVGASVHGEKLFPAIDPLVWRFATHKRVRRSPLDEHPISFSILERWEKEPH